MMMDEVLMTRNFWRVACGVALSSLFLAGCTSSGSAFNPPDGGSAGTERLFIGMNAPQTMSEYASPYTGAPAVSGIAIGEPWNMTTDAKGDVWVANGYQLIGSSEAVTEFKPPFRASSTPAVTISNGISAAVEGVALNHAGDLFVSTWHDNEVLEYAPPLSNSSAPVTTITNGISGPEGLAVDRSGDLWVANFRAFDNVVEYTPPFSNSSAPVLTISTGIHGPQTLAFDSSGNLWVADTGSHTVLEYNPPFSGSSSPAVTISGVADPEALALDSGGHLFVSDRNGNQVLEFAPPFSNSSTPIATIANGVSGPWGLTFVK
jgi:hypothetical protein